MEKEAQKTEAKQEQPQAAKNEQQPAGSTEQKKQQPKKDPQTLSEAERMGYSKQQLRKLEKHLNAKKKKEQKELEAAQKQTAHKEGHKKAKKQEAEVEISPQHLQAFNSQKITPPTNKSLPSEDRENVLVTSALPYVNNVPHLGNIIGCVLSADVYSRYRKLQGDNVLYVCGTDEYGTATEVKALQEKKSPQEVCDYYNKIHGEVYQWFDIAFDHFGRTSTEWHAKITQEIFLSIRKQDKITTEEMSQCHCEGCDLFLADRFIVGTCPYCGFEDARGDQCDKCQKLMNNPTDLVNYYCHICKKKPEVKKTTHFYIKLPEIQQELSEWIDKASDKGKWSDNSNTITKAWLNMGLREKCITRDLKWGVSVPVEGFEHKVFYVWFDAPIGYISITANLLQQDYEKWWKNPEQVKLYQFMGKDNVPFHTVMFPSSLIASKQNWTLLHHISTTEYLNYEGGKFSKRNGTGVFGSHAVQLQKDIPSEVWRYYLLVNRPEKSDSDFSWHDFMEKNNNQLLANLGNLVHRALSFMYNRYDKKIPEYNSDRQEETETDFIGEMESRYERYKEYLNKVQIKEALKFAMEISSRGNKYLQDSKFWEKGNLESGRTETVMNVIANFIRFQSFLIEPFMPSTSAKINFILGLEHRTEYDETLGRQLNHEPHNFIKNFLQLTGKSAGLKQPVPLFSKFSEQQVAEWRERFKGKTA